MLDQLKPFLQEGWKESGFEKLAKIQEEAIPMIVEGRDLIAQSPTGTGKTLAYLLPVLHKIDTENSNIQAVVLASSHELVMQIYEEVQKWSKGSGIQSASFIGGANVKRQLEKLKKRPQIVCGTPGRIQELIKMKKMKMHEVKTVVLDEGDQLMVPEHIQTVESIVKSTLNDRQVVLFSATLQDQTIEQAKTFMDQPEIIRINQTETSAKVDHLYIVCEPREKIEVLRKLGRMSGMKGIAFVRDIGNLSVIAEKLKYRDLQVGVLHSDSKKQERENAIKSFRSGKNPLLLSTDVAARGLDIKDVTHVIHFDLPDEANQYVHRSGRTGRLGSSSGTVISIITPREEKKLNQITKKLGLNVHKKILFKGQITDEPQKKYTKENVRNRK